MRVDHLYGDFVRLVHRIKKILAEIQKGSWLRDKTAIQKLARHEPKKAAKAIKREEFETVKSQTMAMRIRQEHIEERLERLSADVEKFKILKDSDSSAA